MLQIPLTPKKYERLYQESLDSPNEFWTKVARNELTWVVPFTTALSHAQKNSTQNTQWFVDGKLSISYNCLDRHVQGGCGEKTAYLYNNELGQEKKLSYRELLEKVCQASHGLTSLGATKGSRIVIYLPLCLEQIILLLACSRIGAIHSVVYAGFSAEALGLRVNDLQASVVCTANYTQRGGKTHLLLPIVREALKKTPSVTYTVVVERTNTVATNQNEKLLPSETSYSALLDQQPTTFTPVITASNDPLFVLYTSGTTGKPKGIMHSCGGYSVYAHTTAKVNFELSPDDLFWCTADIGWITGHTYTVYGALSNGITSLIYEGSPLYPTPTIWWELIEKYQVTKWYTSPTAVRSLLKHGDALPAQHNLASLKIIGSVGEPLNQAAWEWLYTTVGKKRATVIDTWWQTESGGHLIGGLPSLPQAPARTGKPFFGVKPLLLDEKQQPITQPHTTGHLYIEHSWPGVFTSCWNNPKLAKHYWRKHPAGSYFYTGDIAQFDDAGFFTILGRSDDVINVSGIRLSTAEIESALTRLVGVSEAAVIGVPDEHTGQKVVAFVILRKKKATNLTTLSRQLQEQVKKTIGYFAVPKTIKFVETLPKTRSGKIMRRVLLAQETHQSLGDTSTLESE